MNRRKFLQLAGIGTLVFPGLIGGCSTERDRQLDNKNSNAAPTSLERTIDPRYIEQIKEPENPNKDFQTIYFVYQKHRVDYLGNEAKNNKILEEITRSQTAVFRTLQDLYEKRGLQLIVDEGLVKGNETDVTEPYKFRDFVSKRTNWERFVEDLESSDEMLSAFLKESGVASGSLIASLYPNLYVIGAEEHEKNRRGVDLAKKLVNGNITDKEIDEYVELNMKRSMDILVEGLFKSEEFYKRRLTSNKDFAIVIGAGGAHSKVFEEVGKVSQKEYQFNAVHIYTKMNK